MTHSISYNGHDFSPCVAAELVEPCGHVVEPRTLAVPGRAGAALLGGEVPPRVLRVGLFLDAGLQLADSARSGIRHELYGWLLAPEGGELVVPGDPGMTYKDAVCTDASDWSSLFEDGSCELAFTCYDPYGYGEAKSSTGTALSVGGTKATWPTTSLTAVAGDSVKVTDSGTGLYVLVERTFSEGDSVVVDFVAETVRVNGEDASADVSVASDFFALEPGAHVLAFSGCSAHVVSWVERWA